eukprot:1982632-Pyramimonas_sp.AAC.1
MTYSQPARREARRDTLLLVGGFTGDSGGFTGDSGGFTGDSGGFTGDSGRFTGDSGGFTGDPAAVNGSGARPGAGVNGNWECEGCGNINFPRR